MKPVHLLVVGALAALWLAPTTAQDADDAAASEAAPKVTSRVEETAAGELVLVQTVTIDAPVAEVWAAHTTAEGYAKWAAPVVAVDLRAGGRIRTHYDAEAKIGDPGTIELRVVNYVPERLLTLQADTSDNWPEILKEDAAHLYNVILFEPLGPARTRVVSYGTGYTKSAEMRRLLDFFAPANEGLYQDLIAQLER